MFNQRQLNATEIGKRAIELQTELRRQIEDAYTVGVVYHQATVEPELTSEGPAYRAHIPLVNPSPIDLNLASTGFVNTGGQLAAVSVDMDQVTFRFRELTQDVRDQLREAIRGTEDAIQRHRQAEVEAQLRLQTYADELATLLGEPPADTT